MSKRLTIRKPDDWHVHLRDGAMLSAVVPYTARQFARAIVMPNLDPPISDTAAAQVYRQRILAAVPASIDFTPLMTCYLTDASDADDLAHGHSQGIFTAAKLYPAHATTNSACGVSSLSAIRAVLERMQEIAMPLLIHGEVTDADVDIFDREARFIERVLAPLVCDFPALRIVFEHITTIEAVQFVADSGPNIAATITAHHLHLDRNAMFAGGFHPHAYCLPVAKRRKHQVALREAATSGAPHYFLGTDSAPHRITDKESACGCAGIFSAPYAMESYAAVFDEENALEHLEAFASEHGAHFYGLPLNCGTLTLERSGGSAAVIPVPIEAGQSKILPFHSGEALQWRLV